MKKMRKLLAVLLTMVMVFAMSANVFAANITIEGGAAGSEYAAYKLLNATDGGANEDGALKVAYTLNEKYTAVLQEVTGAQEQTEIIAYIQALDAEGIRTFADTVYGKITAAGLEADYTTATDKFENVDQGYYLIAETKTGNAADTVSLVMLDTAGDNDITVQTKEDIPILEKKVQEKNDSTGTTTDWQDGADYDINDEVPFKLTGTVADNYDEYDRYYYVFHDKMSEGLTFDADSVEVKVDGVKITSGYRVVTEGLSDGCTFEVVFDDLKAIDTVTKDSVITVEFTATLNDKAVIGQPGNPNEAKLEYSNNPYNTGDGDDEDDKPDDTGETPWDKVIVFTYELNVDKTDGDTDAKLEGAEFALYKFDDATGEYIQVGETIKGVTTFTFTGLDAGQYKLVETKAPEGYNKVEDIYFTIEATYETEAADPKLLTLVVKDAEGEVISEGEEATFGTVLEAGEVNTTVENFAGFELPSTGGMGTTILYVAGAVMVLGAAVVLVTRRRMS